MMRGDISALVQAKPPAAGGDISGLAQAVRPTEPGPAAQIPYGPVQGQLTQLPQFNDLGAIRPFGPGESILLSNGSIASEMTYTVPIGNRWAVVPGLWLMNGTATHLTEAQAIEMAQKSGLEWPFSYDTVEQADAYARQREDLWQKTPLTTAQPPLWTKRK